LEVWRTEARRLRFKDEARPRRRRAAPLHTVTIIESTHQPQTWYAGIKHPNNAPTSILTLNPSKPFIFGVNFVEGALVSRSLKSFYGLGPQVCTQLMSKFHIHKTARIGNLGEKQINSLAGELAEMTIESDLKGQMQNNIKRLRDMGTYRGRRHAMGLPVRGQRTRTQVSCGRCLWVAMGVNFGFADMDMADHDCEEVQPHGQAQVSSGALDCFLLSLLSSLSLHVDRLRELGARDAYTTVKIPMYKRHVQEDEENSNEETMSEDFPPKRTRKRSISENSSTPTTKLQAISHQYWNAQHWIAFGRERWYTYVSQSGSFFRSARSLKVFHCVFRASPNIYHNRPQRQKETCRASSSAPKILAMPLC
jgi:small subunit ribosomal protein S13